MKTLSISNVRNRLPGVVADVVAGRETVVLTRYGKPMATIAPIQKGRSQHQPYPLRGQRITVANDFDAPTPGLWDALALAEPHGEYMAASPAKKRRQSKPRGRKP